VKLARSDSAIAARATCGAATLSSSSAVDTQTTRRVQRWRACASVGTANDTTRRAFGYPDRVATTTTRRPGLRGMGRAVIDGFVDNDLLTYASAISFQILSSLVPFLLFVFGMLGFLALEDVWRGGLARDIEPAVSPPAFAVMDEAVEKALQSKNVFWVTAGFLIALWEVSGAVRAVMGVLNRVYGDVTERSWGRRMLVSFALALMVGACWLAAIAVVVLGTLLYGDVGPLLGALLFLVRWAVAGGLLLLAVAVLLHFAPEGHQPLHWVTFGSVLIMAGWVVMSIGFGVYLRDVADYNSIFGGLATIVVLIAYLYASAVVFLGGVQVDALVRDGR
jgi:membrane protein